MSSFSRRDFVALISAAAAGTALAPLGQLNSRAAAAGVRPRQEAACGDLTSFTVPGFGPISPKLPNNTQSLGALAGVPLIAIPDGFEYTAISIVGSTLSDGARVPGSHDGMAAFPGTGGNSVLVRNHERSPGTSSSNTRPPNGKAYDTFGGGLNAGGGTTTVVVDRDGLVVRDWISLAGTIRNCAGGPTPWGSWISCEENVTLVGGNGGLNQRRHGYNFEVPSTATEAVDPVPLVAMGRFNHEAVAVDPRTGWCYETEDRNDSAFYRFVPTKRANKAGDYAQGGELYAMRILPGQTGCDGSNLPTTATGSVDFRGAVAGSPSVLPFLGIPLAVDWVRLEDVDPAEDTLRFEAQAKGAALFWRGEGAWEHQGLVYWVNSNAGDAGEGQVVCYDPRRETLTLVVESTDESLLDGPDNITVARDGTLYLCEDGSAGSPGEPEYSQRVVGVDASGGLFTFALNVVNTNEFAGACFSQDGKAMYVNSQGSGITYAIWRSDRRPITLRGGFV
jgi:uncharacterized protein